MKRIVELDGLRGIAVLMVVVWHYIPCQVSLDSESFVSYAVHLLDLTWSGVDLFFVLSGFLIAGILIDNSPTKKSLKAFYIRRACRILPLYFLILLSFYAFQATGWFDSPAFLWLFQNPLPWWSYTTLTQNLLMNGATEFGPHWLAVTWSLCVEEQFYILLPLVIFFLGKRGLLSICLAGIFVAVLLRFSSGGFHAFVSTPWRADSLLSGVLLAFLVRKPDFMAIVRRRVRALEVAFLILLAGAAFITIKPLAFGQTAFHVFKHIWLAWLYGVLVLLAVSGESKWLAAILRWRILIWFGGLSYGIYLFHQIASGLIHAMVFESAPRIRNMDEALATCSAFFVTLIAAYLSFRCLEQPFLRWGHRYKYDNKGIS